MAILSIANSADEIGIPFCITLDFDGVKDKTVTIRDRDTAKQILVKQDTLREVLQKLLSGAKLSAAGKVLK